MPSKWQVIPNCISFNYYKFFYNEHSSSYYFMDEETEDEFPSPIMFIGVGSLNLNGDFSYSKIHTPDAKPGTLGARCRLPFQKLGLGVFYPIGVGADRVGLGRLLPLDTSLKG